MALTQALRDVTLFKPPDGKCLSPAGEYNLRLGIQKEVGGGAHLWAHWLFNKLLTMPTL